jgi:excinuclease ABC subunit A
VTIDRPSPVGGAEAIRIRGARTHNLKNIDVDLPRHALVVITGPSGSGKSSLAFDTVFAEGQRRYVESLSPHARQFLRQMAKPPVESIEGLSPTIAIGQQSAGANPRSTVGTATEIHDFLRLLYSRAGSPHCPGCGRPILPKSVDQMVDAILALPAGTRLSVLAPVLRGERGDLRAALKRFRRDGFVRVKIDDEVHDLADEIRLDPKRPHDVDIYVDRLVVEAGVRNRLADSVELALKESKGLVVISPVEGEDMTFTDSHSCAACGLTMPALEPSAFSFNTPAGACPTCDGLGDVSFFDEELVVPDATLSLRDGAIAPWARRNAAYYQPLLEAAATKYGIDPFAPWRELPEAARRILLDGTGEEIEFTVTKEASVLALRRGFEGVIPNLERRRRELDRRNKEGGNKPFDLATDELRRYMGRARCGTCGGARLRKESLSVTVGGSNLAELLRLTVLECRAFLAALALPPKEATVAEPLIAEIGARLGFLVKVGLDYLTLDRATDTLSGGEAQRIRLATQIGSALVGVTYVLDEPSVGLHQRDNERLNGTLLELRDRGNTVLVVEHDAETIRAADHVVDMGPGAGLAGGEVVAQGTPAEIARDPKSLTGGYLSGRLAIPLPRRRRTTSSRAVVVSGARANNLKGVTARFPLGLFIAVTGVSGSGKSSLVVDTLLPAARHAVRRAGLAGLSLDGVSGAGDLDKVVEIDQGPIGRTPRSNPATFTQLFGLLRELFASLPESRARGYRAGRYSFNVKGGRCEACQGDGLIHIEMNFLPDAFVTCEVCGGRRYNRETLEVRYKGRSVADVLDMTCAEAHDLFESHPKIRQILGTMMRVGLGYLTLGQNAATLSGGEAQRLKLARELARKATGSTLYVLDEPTTGLHFEDVRRLMEVLQQLVDQGNTVVVIEHNLDVVKCADWVIDLGPEGGAKGGEIVAAGTPEDVACSDTHTGRYLKRALEAGRRG